jgi:hypothetical protein
VFDAGGLGALVKDRVATEMIRALLAAGWEPLVPAPVLVEALQGDWPCDAAMNRVVARIPVASCDASRARHAAGLRRSALRSADPSAVDAIVASHATDALPAIAVTSDPADLEALTVDAPLVRVLSV